MPTRYRPTTGLATVAKRGVLEDKIQELVLVLVPMILSLSVHEYAHAWSAFKLGDDTAERQGRLSLNPAVHIDPIGTLLFPAIAILGSIPFLFGWARPVPINPVRFRRTVDMRTGVMLTALAGPLSNVFLAILFAIAFGFGVRFDAPEAFIALCVVMVRLNIILAIFNLIPIPPLDGSRVVSWLLGPRHADSYNALQNYSWLLLIGFLMLFRGPLGAVTSAITKTLLQVAA